MRFKSLKSLLLGLCCALALAPSQAQLPTLGDGSDMSSMAERKLGERIARELYRDPDYIDDPVLVEYVQTLWQPLLAAARVRGDLTSELDERFAWQVLMGKDRTINAFALPGGWLGLHLGLVSVTANRDELASVLAHELSHVTQRHISRVVSQQSRQAPWLMAGLLLGALAASKSADAGNAVIATTQALSMQNQLNFSREMEWEADRIGLGVLTQAGYEPQGFVTMFEKLQQAARLNDNGNYPYLRTHPMTTERVAEMQSRQQMIARPAGPPPPDFEHALMAARARVLSNPGVDALRGYVAEADPANARGMTPLRQAAVLYAGVLAASKLRDQAAAGRFTSRLLAVTQDARSARIVRLLQAEIALAADEPVKALGFVNLQATQRPDVLLAAQALLQTGKAAEVASRLQTWVSVSPKDAPAWQLLSRAYELQSQPLRSIRAQAEAQVALLDFSAALDRFKAAQDLARRGAASFDHMEASIIDARARQVESLLREQTLER